MNRPASASSEEQLSPETEPSDRREDSEARGELRAVGGSSEDLLELMALKDRQIERLLEQKQELSDHKRRLELALDEIVQSKSWKITKPLRETAVLKRKLFPLLRKRRLALKPVPGNSILESSGSFEIVGPSSYLLLDTEQGEPPATGWARISARLKASQSHLYFFLYHKTEQGGYEVRDRVLLPFASGKRESHLVKLPAECAGLRLDPFSSQGSFELDGVEVRELGSLQVLLAIFNKHITPMISKPRLLIHRLRKAFAIWREGGLVALRTRLFADNFTSNYGEWVKQYDTISERDRDAIRRQIEAFPRKPLLSVVMPTYNTPERWLRAAIESVIGQLYQNWELCIADDASTEPSVRQVLEEYAARDKRIKVAFRKENGHISRASNSALELASGEFVALLDHDDELTEHALYMLAHEMLAKPSVDMFFSDEDKITSYGMRFNPYFKSDWNPDLLLSQNCICHLGAYRAEVLRKIGGFREGFEGAQDWDLALRVADAVGEQRISHIPHVLYHWRVIEGSTAHSTGAKPYVMKAQARAVEEHLERRGVKGAEVRIQEDISQLRVVFPVPSPEPLVSIVIPTKDQSGLLSQCVSSIEEKTAYRNYEIVIVDNNSEEAETQRYFDSLKDKRNIRVIRDTQPFNFSRINNDAIKHARGQIFGFLNNDLEVISPEWLSEMVSHAVRPEIGAVGARLFFPNGLLQHGGVILGIGGIAGHNHKGRPKHDPGYFNRAILTQDLSAVTAACMLMRREVFEELRGFDEVELSVAFNDVDICLRARDKGYRVLYTPYAELYHYESASRGYENTPEKFVRFEKEIENMKRRWGKLLQNDPYYNPNLTLLSEDFVFAFPPRSIKPWRVNQ